ncbi:hypothetical protein H5410_024698 [Solanum commersonii]|uniref:Inositol-pentakisphosphate 2-kinase n=1 Tax=Solanum commersonii TaxID=4109 RepID=A0A9J5ZMN6_SOLCO|nr:hypothetical protein H5410_024698 [Solanum commersonii]
MVMVLQANDAREWCYRGEGAVNLVLAYSGEHPDFVGKVLRVQKVPRNGSQCENGHPGLTELECLMWKEFKELVSAPTKEMAEYCFVQHVMCSLLGSKNVDAGIHIPVTREFLETVDNNVLCQRPSFRVDAAMVNPLCDSVLLISDHSLFPRGALKKDFCISVEIKPKCGFLPLSEFIASENSIKRSVTRFKMHQALKLHQGKGTQSNKGPFQDPTEQFRVFLNGSLILGGLGGNADATSCEVGETFENALKCVIQAIDGQRTQRFLDLISKTIFSSGLLNKVLEVQKLDNADIEGAIHAYYNVISQPCAVCNKRSAEDQLSERYSSLHSISNDESMKIVRNYLIAATAKDLSMMISFRPREDGSVESPYSMVSLESTNQNFDYKAYFIDLDLKPLERMEYYYKLDQQIVGYYVQMVKSTQQLRHIE